MNFQLGRVLIKLGVRSSPTTASVKRGYGEAWLVYLLVALRGDTGGANGMSSGKAVRFTPRPST